MVFSETKMCYSHVHEDVIYDQIVYMCVYRCKYLYMYVCTCMHMYVDRVIIRAQSVRFDILKGSNAACGQCGLNRVYIHRLTRLGSRSCIWILYYLTIQNDKTKNQPLVNYSRFPMYVPVHIWGGKLDELVCTKVHM